MTPSFHTLAFKTAYGCAQTAINLFHNPQDALFNAFYALLHMPFADLEPHTSFKLYHLMAKGYARFRDKDKALLCCDLAEQSICKSKNRSQMLEKINKTRLEALLFSGDKQAADQLLENISPASEFADALHLIRAEYALFRDKDVGTAEQHFLKAKQRLRHLNPCILTQLEASLLLERGDTGKALLLFQSSENAFRSLKPEIIHQNPWYLIRHAETRVREGQPGALDLFQEALGLLNKSAEQGRDILARASFMEMNPGAYECLVENIIPLDPSLAWQTAQQVKNFYLVLELSQENFTYKAWNLLQHNPAAPIPESLRQEILHYDFKPVQYESVPIEAMQRRMPADEMILDYFITEKKCLLFQITRESFRTYELDLGKKGLENETRKGEDLIAACSDSTLSLELRDTTLLQETAEFSRRLGKILLPFPELAPKITVVPHKFLHHMPFQILRHSEDAPPLCQQCVLTFSYNVLTRPWEENSPAEKKFLFLHDRSMPFANREFQELSKKIPFIEVRTVDDLVRHCHQSGIIHFAGHFEFSEIISRSYFELGEGNRIVLKDLFSLRFDGADILLNVCESGKNTIYGSETEYFDAARFFIRQGARHVLTTFNPIRNGTAFLFAKELYSRFPGIPLPEAFHNILQEHPQFALFCPYIIRC